MTLLPQMTHDQAYAEWLDGLGQCVFTADIVEYIKTPKARALRWIMEWREAHGEDLT